MVKRQEKNGATWFLTLKQLIQIKVGVIASLIWTLIKFVMLSMNFIKKM